MKKRIACALACCCLLFGCGEAPAAEPTGEQTVQTDPQPTFPEETTPQEAPASGEEIRETQPQQEDDTEKEVPPAETKPVAGNENTTNTPGGNTNTTDPTPNPGSNTDHNTSNNANPDSNADHNTTGNTTTGSTAGSNTTNNTTGNTTTGSTGSSAGTTSGTDVPSSYVPPTYPDETDNEVLMFRYDTMTIPLGSSKKAELFYFGNGTLRWYSLKPSLVTISQDGLITPLWDGTLIIYVTDGTYTDSIYVKVPKENEDTEPSLYFEKSSIEIYEGETIDLKVKGSAVAHYYTVTYTSSDFTVASIYSRDELKGHNSGTTIITAECAGHRATMVVTVVPAPPKGPELRLTHSSLNLRVGGEFQLHPIYTGSGTLRWVSMDPDIVKVEDNGLVTAVGVGTGKFCVTDGELTVYCQVNVLG